MKTNKSNRIFRGLTISLVLCAVVISVFSPVAFAVSSTYGYAVVNVSVLNVRTGPGLSYNVAFECSKGDILYLTGLTCNVDGYTWYELDGGNDYWIAYTGGWTLYEGGVYEDTINAYSASGVNVWSHTCCGSSPDWFYHLEVHSEGYYVRCDCGWWDYRSIPTQYDSDGNVYLCFLGLDTDNDERVDLKPGQSKDLPNRANGELRPYQILEFLDKPNKDIPTVTLCFHDADYNVISEYSFYWDVDVHVESYGIVMEGMDGTKKIHYVDGDFLVYDRADGLFLGDNVRTYVTNRQHNGKEYITLGERHMTFYFELSPPGEGSLGPLEWITHTVRSIVDLISDLLDFFGLGFIFTDEDSPFRFLMGV